MALGINDIVARRLNNRISNQLTSEYGWTITREPRDATNYYSIDTSAKHLTLSTNATIEETAKGLLHAWIHTYIHEQDHPLHPQQQENAGIATLLFTTLDNYYGYNGATRHHDPKFPLFADPSTQDTQQFLTAIHDTLIVPNHTPPAEPTKDTEGEPTTRATTSIWARAEESTATVGIPNIPNREEVTATTSQDEELPPPSPEEIREKLAPYKNSDAFTPTQLSYIRAAITTRKDYDALADPDLIPQQQAEILQGLKANVDVTQYNHPAFSTLRMRTIRHALAEGLPITTLQNLDLNSNQVHEIYQGLAVGAPAELWAQPNIDYGIMEQYRKAWTATNTDYTTIRNLTVQHATVPPNALTNATWENCHFTNCTFTDPEITATLTNCRFTNCTFTNPRFTDATIQGTAFIACTITEPVFTNTTLQSNAIAYSTLTGGTIDDTTRIETTVSVDTTWDNGPSANPFIDTTGPASNPQDATASRHRDVETPQQTTQQAPLEATVTTQHVNAL